MPQPASGVLLINLGTPHAPTAAAVRRYLGEFLGDPAVVPLPRALWLPLLHGVVLPLRAPRVARLYARIWTPAGSPLLVNSRAIAAALARARPAFAVALGMRYGEPDLRSALLQLREAGVRRLLLLPLYPQYSRTTTGTARAAVEHELRAVGWAPELRAIEHYAADAGYVAALRASVQEHWQRCGRAERLLISFHGIPARVAAGEPYEAQCHATGSALAGALGLADGRWQVVFQSRFGRGRWSEPPLLDTLDHLAAQGVRTLDVVCPGFPADCLETLDEIALRANEHFARAGGQSLRYISALNDRSDHVTALAALADRALAERP